MIVEELIKTYDGKPVVDSVSFSLPKGKVTSLIGPNGAGKSTVMGMISRLIARDGDVYKRQLHLLHRLDFFTDKCLLFGEQLNEKRCCPVVQI